MILDKEEFVDELEFGNKESFLELSPYYNSSNIVIGHLKYSSLIHYWLSTKYEAVNNSLYSFKTPESVISFCKKRFGFKDFDEIDSKTIISSVIINLRQNKDIKDMLMSTSGYHLIFKGVGYLAEENRYGRLLEHIRDKYGQEL